MGRFRLLFQGVKNLKIDVLGTAYDVVFKNYEDEPLFKKRSLCSYSDDVDKVICICNMQTYPGFEDESQEYCHKMERGILRHEIIHSFLSESGLQDSACVVESSWAKNEEMVDWMALQLPKIVEACKAVDAM